MNDLVATLKELEHLGNDSVQVIHNSVKHVIADLTEQLARLVLYGIESDQLLGYPKQGGPPSDSTGSKETVSLEIQEKQVAAFTDAGHADEEFVAQENDLGGKSTTGSVIFLNGCVVAWNQSCRRLSPTALVMPRILWLSVPSKSVSSSSNFWRKWA